VTALQHCRTAGLAGSACSLDAMCVPSLLLLQCTYGGCQRGTVCTAIWMSTAGTSRAMHADVEKHLATHPRLLLQGSIAWAGGTCSEHVLVGHVLSSAELRRIESVGNYAAVSHHAHLVACMITSAQ
jgi:hypothetical protein